MNIEVNYNIKEERWEYLRKLGINSFKSLIITKEQLDKNPLGEFTRLMSFLAHE